MPGAGTDKTRSWVDVPAPIVILVEPQLGENIGAAARAMANFGLSRLRLVKPRAGLAEPGRQTGGLGRRPHAGRRRGCLTRSRRRSPTARWCSRPPRAPTTRQSP